MGRPHTLTATSLLRRAFPRPVAPTGPAPPIPAPRLPAPSAYWWTGKPNFGDALNPLLLDWFADVRPRRVPAADADVIVCGSVLEHLPAGFTGIVAGAGKMYEQTDLGSRLAAATVLALRGPLSAKGVPGDYALGDPGLLAAELVVDADDKVYNLGIVPHWSDTTLEHRHEFKGFSPHIIRPDGDPLEVVREIGRCRKVVSSSLHGLIVADAFGIPRRTEVATRMEKEGGMFKFRDHCAAVGVPFEVGVTQTAPRYMVERRQHEIYDVLASVGRRLMGAAR